MFKNRRLPALVLTITLLWGCTSGAMFDGFKKYISTLLPSVPYLIGKQEEMIIKPFTSDEEKKKAFHALKNYETKLDCRNSEADHDLEMENYHKNLLMFFQKLFKNKVEEDIKKGEPYTIAFGLKIDGSGEISMEQPPLNENEEFYEQKLLFRLSYNPQDTDASNKLRMLYQKNKNSFGSAESLLFPKIVIRDKYSKENRFAQYDPTKNIIFMQYGFGIKNCRTVLHEFGHCLQNWRKKAECALTLIPISQEQLNSKLPLQAECEIDAEKLSIDLHPDKEEILKDIDVEAVTHYPKDGPAIFPYFSEADVYARVLKNLKLDDKEPYRKIIENIGQARKEIEKDAAASFYHSPDRYLYYTELVRSSATEKLLASLYFIGHCLSYNISAIRDVSKGSEKILKGSNEFFNIKCKVLKTIELEKKMSEKKQLFPMTISKKF